MARPKLLMLELNEVNFDFVQTYIDRGFLPNFKTLIERYGFAETTSEARYEELEPWIQWVTAHTGLSLAQHGVCRLGDIMQRDILQIWEHLEANGLVVGAISPMNANNRLKNPAFFVPDPWTPASTSGGVILKRLSSAVSQAVNDNAQSRLALSSLLWLALGALRYARVDSYPEYFRLAKGARMKPWFKAMFLDLLLSDVFIKESINKNPEFCSLFLNSSAHIQHHYMFNSSAYRGEMRNPSWYVSENLDPLLDAYQVYDKILGEIIRVFPDYRLMIATGLHQDPYPKLTVYWRLKRHDDFLRKAGVLFEAVEPRMSRDFLVKCQTPEKALAAEQRLKDIVADDGVPLFDIHNRGCDLFVMLTYPHEIGDALGFRAGNVHFKSLRNDVAFVAIKNGEHNGIGYFLDTGNAVPVRERFALTEIPQRICAALGVGRMPICADK